MKLSNYFLNITKPLMAMALGLVLLSTQSCLKDFPTDPKNLGYKPSFAAPLGSGSLSLKNLLLKASDTLKNILQEAPDHSLTLVYSSDLFSQNGGTSFALPDENATPTPFKFDAATIGAFNASKTAITQVFNDTFDIQIPNAGNSQIDKVILKNGLFNLNVRSTFQDSIQVTIDVPSLKQPNGVPFKKIVNLNYTNATPIIDNKINDLSGYTLTTLPFPSANRVPYTVTIRVKYVSKAYVTDEVKTAYTISNILFSRVEGRFSGINIPIPSDSVAIDAFNNPLAGAIALASPEINIYLKNTIGIPVKLNFTKFSARLKNGTSVTIPNAIPYTKKLRFPALNQIGQAVIDTIAFNGNNSHVKDVINGVPSKFSYDIYPKIGDSTVTGFLSDTAGIKVRLETKLPLNLSITNLTLRDTIPMDVSGVKKDLNYAESGNFRLTTTNQFPFGIDLQVYFYDKTNRIIVDSLSKKGTLVVLKPGGTGSDGKVNIANVKPYIADFTMDHEQLINLGKANYMITKAVINTYQNQQVQLYSDYKLGISAGILISKIDVFNIK